MHVPVKNLTFLVSLLFGLSFCSSDEKPKVKDNDKHDQEKSDAKSEKKSEAKSSETENESDNIHSVIQLKKSAPKTATEVKYNLSFDGNEIPFSITADELMNLVWKDSRGQIVNLFGKRKELDASIRKGFQKLFEQKKTLAIVKILVGRNSPVISKIEYNACLDQSKTKLMAQNLLDLVELNQSDLAAAKASLLNEQQATYTGLYVVVNKEAQARDIIRYFEVGSTAKRSSAEVFTEGASQYALVKTLEDGYSASESEISSKFGNDILDAVNEMREGGCSKPIKKSNRYMVVWLKEKGLSKLNESSIYSYAISTKIDSVVSESIERMKKDGSIQILVSDFNESDLEESEKYLRPVLKIAEYTITNHDLRRFIESMLQKKSLKEMVMRYNTANRPAVLSYFFKTSMDMMISIYVKAIIANKLGVTAENVEISNNDSERLFMKYVRSLITDQMIRDRFEKQKDSIPKTRISAEYITLESKKVTDNVMRILLSEQEKQIGEREFLILFNKIKDEYSIDDNAIFDERISQMKETFGYIEPMERNKTKPDEPLRINTLYLFRNNKTNLYHIVFVKNINDEVSIEYEERRREILAQIIDETAKDIYGKCKWTKV